MILRCISADRPCVQRVYKSTDHNVVCVCNATYCDDIKPLITIPNGKAVIYVSSLAGKRFKKSVISVSEEEITDAAGINLVSLSEATRKRALEAYFGENDAAGINLVSLSEATRKRALEAYFGENGIGYNMGRVPIASTDFSTREYSYADTAGDMEMKTFSLLEDDLKYKIPYILTAMNLTGGAIRLFASPWSAPGWMKTNGRMKVSEQWLRQHVANWSGNSDFFLENILCKLTLHYTFLKHFEASNNSILQKSQIPYILTAMNLTGGAIRLFASPWSAPGWMKTNGRMKGGGMLKGAVNGEYYQSYAIYLTKFFEEYAKNGVPFWGMTLQNEPSSGMLPFYGWQTMLFTADMERDFAKGILGPMFKSNKATKDLKVMALDDNRLWLPRWADNIFNDPEATKYVDGIGVHWYMNALVPATACTGSMGIHGPILGDWYRAEEYAEDIITNLNNFVSGWVDWNMWLNERGGPTWVNNFVDSPIIVNATTDEFYKQPMFYAIGHFSKFIKAGSKRIATKVDGKQAVLATAVNYQGRRTLVLLNHHDDSQDVVITDSATGHHISLNVDPHCVVTVLWERQ
ncbi:unnamed protein product [Strongylus vulgaris]|uniref:Glucosylceramidase n=1 Tax=Strongylus vulgaris TaxID=40348 RepID=A0A3P7J4W5_STRVU|nr:unnamed protein product [Strongylus vulgaris]